jgi:hypothetical protein
MKTTLKEFRKLIRQEFKRMLTEGDVDSERRRNYGYDEADSGQGVEYHDLPESLEIEDVDRLRRAADGYGETEFEESLDEQPMPPPSSGVSGQRAAAFGKALDPKTAMAKGMELVSMVMSQVGSDPQAWNAFVRAAKKYHPQHPLSKLPAGLSPAPPKKESSEPSDEEDKKKRVAKSHAAPSSGDDYPGPPAASEGFDAASGRDPKKTCPFNKDLKLPIHNMSDEEDVVLDLDIDVDLEEADAYGGRTPAAFKKDPFWGKQTGQTAGGVGRGTGTMSGHGTQDVRGWPEGGSPVSPPGSPPTGWADPDWEKRLRGEGEEMPKLSQLGEKEGLPSKEKAKKMMKDKEAHGKPLTKKQKGLFGMIAGGEKPTKL